MIYSKDVGTDEYFVCVLVSIGPSFSCVCVCAHPCLSVLKMLRYSESANVGPQLDLNFRICPFNFIFLC